MNEKDNTPHTKWSYVRGVQVSGTVATSAGKLTLSALKAFQCVSPLNAALYQKVIKGPHPTFFLRKSFFSGLTLYNRAFLRTSSELLSCTWGEPSNICARQKKTWGGVANNPNEGFDDIRLVLKIKPLAPAITKKKKSLPPAGCFHNGPLGETDCLFT